MNMIFDMIRAGARIALCCVVALVADMGARVLAGNRFHAPHPDVVAQERIDLEQAEDARVLAAAREAYDNPTEED